MFVLYNYELTGNVVLLVHSSWNRRSADGWRSPLTCVALWNCFFNPATDITAEKTTKHAKHEIKISMDEGDTAEGTENPPVRVDNVVLAAALIVGANPAVEGSET